MVTPLLLLFSLIFLLIHFLKTTSTKKRLPPSPLSLPVLGNLHLVGPFPHRSFHSLSNRYGELTLLHFGSTPVLLASSPAAAREIMKNQDLIFANRPNLSIPEKLFYKSNDIAFSPHGDHWRRARGMLTLRLLSNKKVQSFRGIREEETSLLVEKMRRSPPPCVVDLSGMLLELTNGVVCRAALGRKYGGAVEKEFSETREMLIEVLGGFKLGDFVPWLGWINRINGLDGRVERVYEVLDGFLGGVLRDCREKEVSDDGVVSFGDALLEFQRESGADVLNEDR